MKKIVYIPPNYFYLCIILSIVLRFVFPEFKIIPSPYDITGLVLIILGLYLVIDSWYLFKKHNTPESFEPTTFLVKDGIYKYSRNPQIVFYILFLAGYALIYPGWPALLWIGILLFMCHIMVITEEEHLLRTFVDEYKEYCKRTSRYIGLKIFLTE